MAQNGFDRRSASSTARTYPGAATRVRSPRNGGDPPPQRDSARGRERGGGSSQTVFSRPLSRSQLVPVHGVSESGGESGLISPGSGGSVERPISLEQPRPKSERNRNLYLSAPLPHNSHSSSSGVSGSSSASTNGSKLRVDSDVTAAEQVRLPTSSANHSKHGGDAIQWFRGRSGESSSRDNSGRSSTIITSQPTKRTRDERLGVSSSSGNINSNDNNNNSNNNSNGSSSNRSSGNNASGNNQNSSGGGGGSGGGVGVGGVSGDSVIVDTGVSPTVDGDEEKRKLPKSSIVCPYCRKCRCEACATPRPLPSKWICSKSVHCGPEPFLDYVTCLCCVKGLFYHCGKNHEPDGAAMCADKPCSCAPHRKFWRWGCMGAMSLVLPCLCLYWPCKGCLRLTEKLYQRYHKNGCVCRSPNLHGESSGSDASEDEERATNPYNRSHQSGFLLRSGTSKLLPPPYK